MTPRDIADIVTEELKDDETRVRAATLAGAIYQILRGNQKGIIFSALVIVLSDRNVLQPSYGLEMDVLIEAAAILAKEMAAVDKENTS